MSGLSRRIGIYTLGCKVNQYESEAIRERCAALGLEVSDPRGRCDAYIINTCTVTAEADRKARQYIRRAADRNPGAYIIVTGCAAQINPGAIAAIGGVDFICGNTAKLDAASAAASLLDSGCKQRGPDALFSPHIAVSDIGEAPFEKMSIGSFGRARACVKIEDGCESSCSYCIIPAARGRIRSKPPAEVIDEVRKLTAGGCREVVLTGIETAAYGRDLPGVSLASLLRGIDRVEGIGRVRLGSLDPSALRREFIEEIAGIRSLAPHLHLSVQSGSDRILTLMRRKYNADMLLRSIEKLRESIPGIQLTADMIVGFPQESDADFAESAGLMRSGGFLSAHIFTYSRRAGTVAASMPGQIPEPLKRERAAALAEVSRDVRRSILERLVAEEPEQKVLFESFDGRYAHGHTAAFVEVAAEAEALPEEGIRDVLLRGHDGETCFGELI